MAEKKTQRKDLVVKISYCPCLGVYHYTRSDGDDYFWDNGQLEATLEAYLRDGHLVDAEFMARVTAGAREHPHKVVAYLPDGTCRIEDPVVPEWVPRSLADSGGGPAGGGGSQEER